MSAQRPVLGITMGDPAGVGPEIIAAALSAEAVYERCVPIVIGDAGVMEAACQLMKVPLEVAACTAVGKQEPSAGTMVVLDMKKVDLQALSYGEVSAMAGEAAYAYVERAAELALQGDVDAIVTAPLNKAALNEAGRHFAGHTEILASLCGVQDVAMMLVAGNLRVSHVSTHCALREACDRVRRERVSEVLRLTVDALRQMGIETPRVAVAGLNPHAGEGGLFGREELEEIAPAIEEARAGGLHVIGPEPPDTIFLRALQHPNAIHAVVAMYHDQGHIAVKMADFFGGVNLTLGLPILRTSVDHGTAFDIAWQGQANPDSLHAALRLAAVMSAHRGH